MTDVTRILSAIEGGDPSAAEQLLPLVYEELRRLAAQRMSRQQRGTFCGTGIPSQYGIGLRLRRRESQRNRRSATTRKVGSLLTFWALVY